MPHTTLEIFPNFKIGELPSLAVLVSAQLSPECAREYPRIYHEAAIAKGARANFTLHRHEVSTRTVPNSTVLGAYADTRPSSIYPRLDSFLEAEVLSVPSGYRLNVRAKHGNQQDSVGGSFEFAVYPAAVLYVAAWIWFATVWIGKSWTSPAEVNHPLFSFEILDVNDLPRTIPFRTRPAVSMEDQVKERRTLQRLFRMVVGTDSVDEESRVSLTPCSDARQRLLARADDANGRESRRRPFRT